MRACAVLGAAILLSAAALAPAALAGDGSVEAARKAAEALRGAIAALQAAEKARDRVAALTRTIGAYEDGLAVMREGLRRTAVRERQLTDALALQHDRLGSILGAMTAIGETPQDVVLLHPDGPLSTVRSGLVLSAVAPALETEAGALRADLAEIAAIRRLREESAATLQSGLDAAQEARTALSEAMQDRTALPRRFIDEPEELRALVEGAETLDRFAAGLAALEMDVGPPLADFAGARGTLALPVRGRLLRRAGEADAAGIRRPGLVIATLPAALVTTPWPATIRYRGPLLDYGNVMILEPAKGYLLVLAGLGTVYGETGDILAAGAPVGLMPGDAGGEAAFAAGAQDAGGAGRTETLYIELRQGAEPVDPGGWFRETRED